MSKPVRQLTIHELLIATWKGISEVTEIPQLPWYERFLARLNRRVLLPFQLVCEYPAAFVFLYACVVAVVVFIAWGAGAI